MHFRDRPGYSFDDVLLVPQYSEITSRGDVDLSTTIGKLKLKLPLLSANMDSVTEFDMAFAMSRHSGGAGVMHRFASLEDQHSCSNLFHLFFNYLFDFFNYFSDMFQGISYMHLHLANF